MNPMPRVLVYEEDPEMRNLLSELLLQGGAEAVRCGRPAEVLKWLQDSSFDLLVTDSKVSNLGLRDFLRSIRTSSRSNSQIRILILSDDPSALSASLEPELGELSILSKPFDRGQFVAGVRAQMRLQSRMESQISSGALVLDKESYDVHLNGIRLHLTQSEFRLLKELVLHPNEILSRDYLIQKVQGEGIAVVDRAVDTHVFSLRKKIGILCDRIESVRGSGYRWNSEPMDSKIK